MRTPQQAMREAMESGAFDAWMMGRKVQVRTDDTQWELAPHPKFQDPRFYFRPAPTPKLRPWNPEEVPVGARMREVNESGWFTATSAGNNGIGIITPNGFQIISFQNLLDDHEHSTDGGKTWKPCGVMEGES